MGRKEDMHQIEVVARQRASLEWHANGSHPAMCEDRERETKKTCPCGDAWREYLTEAAYGMRFILWNTRKDGPVTRDERGEITTGGTLGRIDGRNVYLVAYAEWPQGRSWADLFALAVGECIPGVGYSLSGERRATKARGKDRFESFTYDVYRVE
jgi:hypothetical protein